MTSGEDITEAGGGDSICAAAAAGGTDIIRCDDINEDTGDDIIGSGTP